MVDRQQDIDKLAAIKSIVHRVRREGNYTPTPGCKPEGSCFASPEEDTYNLFWAQLVPTSEGAFDSGEWSALQIPEIRDKVFEYASSLEDNKKKVVFRFYF